jgi:hypothetical protein
MTEYQEIVGTPESEEEHREQSNPLNSRTKTANWLSSTLKTGVRKSDLSEQEVLNIAENAVKQAGADNHG